MSIAKHDKLLGRIKSINPVWPTGIVMQIITGATTVNGLPYLFTTPISTHISVIFCCSTNRHVQLVYDLTNSTESIGKLLQLINMVHKLALIYRNGGGGGTMGGGGLVDWMYLMASCLDTKSLRQTYM